MNPSSMSFSNGALRVIMTFGSMAPAQCQRLPNNRVGVEILTSLEVLNDSLEISLLIA